MVYDEQNFPPGLLTSEKSVGTTELHYSTKKREHPLSILKAFFVRHSSDVSYSDECRTKKLSVCLKNVPAFSCYSELLTSTQINTTPTSKTVKVCCPFF